MQNCPNCGYGFLNEAKLPQRTYHACPRCSHRFDPPLTVGRADESSEATAPYRSIVERSND